MVSFIKNFMNIIGEKMVNDIFWYDDNLVFMAGIYGVFVFCLDNVFFFFIIFMGDVNVLLVVVFEGNIYVGMIEGIYCMSINNLNVDDFSIWDFLGIDAGFLDDYFINVLVVY